METKKTLRRVLAFCLVACTLLLAACGTTSGNTTETKKNNNSGSSQSDASGDVLNFVAADKTNWDLEVSLGDYSYTVAVNLKADNTVEVKATCVGRVEAASGGNMGGSGNTAETEAPAETQPPMTDADKEAQNFSYTGTWSYDKGYGYTIELPNGTVKTDFDKASSRQYFYAELVKGDLKSDLTQFQAKDSSFRKEIAADYEIYEVREAEYIFSIVVQGNNNPNSTTLYLEKDGVANSLVYSGSSPTYKRGMWNIDPEDDLLTVYIEDEMIKADYCDLAGKEGYRINYNSNTMFSRDDVEYTSEDFEGAVTKQLTAASGATLSFTEKGFVNLVDGEDSYTGKYTEENGVVTVTIKGNTFVSENGALSVSVEKSSGSGGSGSTETLVYDFNLDGSVPEAAPAEGGDGGSGGEGGETAPVEGEGEGNAPAEGEGAPAEGEGASGGEGSGGEGAPETSEAEEGGQG